MVTNKRGVKTPKNIVVNPRVFERSVFSPVCKCCVTILAIYIVIVDFHIGS